MYLQSTLSVRHETKVVRASSEEGLAIRAKEMAREAKQSLRRGICTSLITYGFLLSLSVIFIGWLGLLVFVFAASMGELFTARAFKCRGALTSLWYDNQWHKAWQIEYDRLSAPDSRLF